MRGLAEQARGLARFDRRERLTAAHAVVVLCAYFEVLSEMTHRPPAGPDRPGMVPMSAEARPRHVKTVCHLKARRTRV